MMVIFATNITTDGTDLMITTGSGDVTGYNNGIDVTNFGSGVLSITTGAGAITGNNDDGINALITTSGTDLTITTTGNVTGGIIGIDTRNIGTGDTVININSGTVTGGSGQALRTQTLTGSDGAITVAAGASVVAGTSGVAIEDTDG